MPALVRNHCLGDLGTLVLQFPLTDALESSRRRFRFLDLAKTNSKAAALVIYVDPFWPDNYAFNHQTSKT